MAYGKSKLQQAEVARLELLPPTAEQHALLWHTAGELRRIANECVVTWLLYHREQRTREKLERREPASACPPELCRQFRRQAIELAPEVHYGTMLALTNWLAQTITAQKSPKHNCKRWTAVLHRLESPWAFMEPLPIRLWNGNGGLERGDGGLWVSVRLDRRRVEGKKNMVSSPLRVAVRRPTAGKRTADHRAAYAAACEIADGRRSLSQSQIAYDRRLKKWFLFVTVEGPPPAPHAARDASRTLFVRPGATDALRIHAGSISGGFGDDALDRVARVRANLDERRRSLGAAFDGAPPPHALEHLSSVWRRQSAAICDALADEVVRSLKHRDFGRVVWFDGNNRRAALALAGRASERDSRELFPFELLRRKASKRLGELGVEVIGRANFRSVKRRKAERAKRLSVSPV